MLDFTTLINQAADTFKPTTPRHSPEKNKVKDGVLQKTIDSYQVVMKGQGPMTAKRIACNVGTDNFSATGVLKRLMKAGYVMLDDTHRNTLGRPLHYWTWID